VARGLEAVHAVQYSNVSAEKRRDWGSCPPGERIGIAMSMHQTI
jgi:hypothetical protein